MRLGLVFKPACSAIKSLRHGQLVDVQLLMMEVDEAVVGVMVEGEMKSGQIVTLLAIGDGSRLRSRTAFDVQAFFNAVPQSEYTIVIKQVEMGPLVNAGAAFVSFCLQKETLR